MIPGSANALLLATAAGEAGGYSISRSVRFNSSDSAYLSKSFASAGNRTVFTFAFWIKRAKIDAYNSLFSAGENYGAGTKSEIWFDATGELNVQNRVSNSNNTNLKTNAVFRDPSAWYHIVIAINSSTSAKIYVNSIEQTLATNTVGGSNWSFNAAISHALGRYNDGGGSGYIDAYLADIHFIDGQALDPTSFTEVDATTGQLVPIEYTGSYGTNGFHLDFSDNSTAAALGTDTSGNSNTWTVNNISVAAGSGNDSLVDTPSSAGTDTGLGGQVSGNYCTLNPLDKGSTVTLANGNLDASVTSPHNIAAGTVMVSSGKYYAEFVYSALEGGTGGLVGVCNPLASRTSYLGGTAGGVGYNPAGSKWVDGVNTGGLTTSAVGDVIGIALDKDSNQVSFYKNNTLIFTQTGLNSAQPYTFAMGHNNSAGSFNFGQRQWAYAAPAGFKALCDTNLPAPVVAKPSEVMDVVTYTGNGNSTRTISGLQFSPDLVWTKARNQAYGQNWYDIVRGAANVLRSDLTNAELNSSPEGYLSAFTSDGYTMSAGSNSAKNGNELNTTYVGWAFDAGSSTVSNTQGSITSSVRANASAGFSIVSYTTPASGNYTVGHGLNVAPSLIILKSRGAASPWLVYHSTVCDTVRKYLTLNTTNALLTDPQDVWGSTLPNSTIFSVLANNSIATSQPAIAYCFAPVSGYSSFGSYTGNGSADGPFVFCGFRPRWVLIKKSSGTENWRLHDTARSTYNVMQSLLFPNLSNAETTNAEYNLDVLSNGFKIRTNVAGSMNDSGATYIYAAFAESPFQYARAR